MSKKIIDSTYISYNRSNSDRARSMRKEQTVTEKIAWKMLRKKKFWYIFLRQKLIDSFILDFYCSKLLLGIEIDWWIHTERIQYDLERDTKLHKKGIKVIRYDSSWLLNDIKWRKENIKKEIKIREKELI